MLPVQSLEPGTWLAFGSFTTNSTSNLTVVKGVHNTVARSGVGTFVVTIRGGDPYFVEAIASGTNITEEATPSANWTRITAIDFDGSGAAGATVNITVLDDNATPAALETTGKVVSWWVLFRWNKAGTDGSVY